MHSPDYTVPYWMIVDEVNQNTNDNRVFYCAGVHLAYGTIL